MDLVFELVSVHEIVDGEEAVIVLLQFNLIKLRVVFKEG